MAARVASIQLDRFFTLKNKQCVHDLMFIRERVEAACVSCCGPQGSSCTSLDCPSLYRWTCTLVPVGKFYQKTEIETPRLFRRRNQEKRVGQLVMLRSLMDGLQI